MKHLLNLFLLVILISSAQANEWELLDNDTKIPNSKNREYTFFIRQTQSLDGTIYSINTNGRFCLIKSDDKAITWDTCFYTPLNSIGASTYLYDVVKNDNNLYVPADSGRLYRSFDKGQTWDYYLFEDEIHPIQYLKFVDNNVGYIGHMLNCGLYKTTDGGESWNPLPNAGDIFKNNFSFNSFIPVSEGVIYLVGRRQGSLEFYKTIDDGKNWEKFESNRFPESEFNVHNYRHLNYYKPYFVVENRYKPNALGNLNLMRSTDFVNWEQLFISDTISGGKTLNALNRYGNLSIGLGKKLFIISKDNGDTWIDLYDQNDDFYARENQPTGFALIDGYVYAQGSILEENEEGIIMNIPKMYRYKLDIETNVESELYNTLLFPNPSGDVVNISTPDVIDEIRVIDLNGISRLNIEYSDNSKSKAIRIDNLERGVYFIQVNNKYYKRLIKK